MTLATNGYETHRKTSRKEAFLSHIDTLVSWTEFCTVIEPFYLKANANRVFTLLALINLGKWGEPLTGEERPA